MTFALLALVCLVGLAGPLLAIPRRAGIPVVVGQLAVGLLLGATGLGVLDSHDRTFSFLAEMGFALIMLVAGTHVPMRSPSLRAGLRRALAALALTVPAAVALGLAVAWIFGTGHGAVYAVLFASSSSALIVPVLMSGRASTPGAAPKRTPPPTDLESWHPGAPVEGPEEAAAAGHVAGAKREAAASANESSDPALVSYLPQVAIADALAILAIPLVVNPGGVGHAAVGGAAVLVAGLAAFFALRWVESSGVRRRVHDVSEDRSLAIELRVELTLLFALAALAVWAGVSVMLAGFALGVALAAVGQPRRVAKQVFALTEGLFGPIFFVWYGASLNLRSLGTSGWAWGLACALLLGAVLAHLPAVLLGQRLPLALLASAQMGVPVAVTTLGLASHLLRPEEPGAMVVACAGTIAVAAVAGRAARSRPA